MIWLVFWLTCLADHGSFKSNDLWWPNMCDPGRLTITRYQNSNQTWFKYEWTNWSTEFKFKLIWMIFMILWFKWIWINDLYKFKIYYTWIILRIRNPKNSGKPWVYLIIFLMNFYQGVLFRVLNEKTQGINLENVQTMN